MAIAAARRSACGSSTFFAFTVFLLCLSSTVMVSGHSIVLEKKHLAHRQLAARESSDLGADFKTVVTDVTTTTEVVSATTTISDAAVVSASSTTISSAKSSTASSFASSSRSSSTFSQTTTKAQSSSSTRPPPSQTPSSIVQRPSASAENFSPSSNGLTESKIPSATPSSPVLPSQPSAPASASTPDATPVTTFVAPLGFKSSPSSSSVSISAIETIPVSTSATPTSNPVAAASRSSGFWKNKGAVAAVFVIISLLAAGALIVAFIVLRKRQRARKLREEHADVWEKYTSDSHRSRSDSPGPSINAAPLDAFAARDESYIPASGDYGSGLQHTSFYSATPVQHPDYYTDYPPVTSQPNSSSSLIATPSKAAPPTAFRQPVGRGSYQQSIDSFYGATGRAL